MLGCFKCVLWIEFRSVWQLFLFVSLSIQFQLFRWRFTMSDAVWNEKNIYSEVITAADSLIIIMNGRNNVMLYEPVKLKRNFRLKWDLYGIIFMPHFIDHLPFLIYIKSIDKLNYENSIQTFGIIFSETFHLFRSRFWSLTLLPGIIFHIIAERISRSKADQKNRFTKYINTFFLTFIEKDFVNKMRSFMLSVKHLRSGCSDQFNNYFNFWKKNYCKKKL